MNINANPNPAPQQQAAPAARGGMTKWIIIGVIALFALWCISSYNGLVSQEEDVEMVLDLLMIAKYLERIGDHATNIAEWVEFSITGTHKSETHV